MNCTLASSDDINLVMGLLSTALFLSWFMALQAGVLLRLIMPKKRRR
ncbi:hypothetical protein [Beggiatoa leptomitoformis]|uniref:Uncharacterized protein n=1 Tax=Beggiatoa leptomitoformis TaxID=288004 RepID=A0A650GCK6_9GAMM|nr:hypothetical protein [Beggiatoa leptomitoformis]QGX03424.1 hypothetical protein AL038_18176 [Beggiatoa leptomitoformis]QGX04014.1 hypothetical protein BLE401_18360 [Beggiatoa leptomitoformis]